LIRRRCRLVWVGVVIGVGVVIRVVRGRIATIRWKEIFILAVLVVFVPSVVFARNDIRGRRGGTMWRMVGKDRCERRGTLSKRGEGFTDAKGFSGSSIRRIAHDAGERLQSDYTVTDAC
jgi:hypothetical protein